MKKPIWRLIVGVLLIAAVSNSLRKTPDIPPERVVWFVIFNLLFAALGVWLAVSFLRKPPN
jgi:hypothetical protein